MPALVPPPLTETTLPAAARFRLWKHPELQSHSLLVMTFEDLRLAPLAGSPKVEDLDGLEAGSDPEVVLGSQSVAVQLSDIRQVKLDLLGNAVTLHYTGSAAGPVSIVFATAEAADAFFTKLWRRLGTGCQLLPFKRDNWSLARAPLAALALVITLTLAAAVVANLFEDYSSTRNSGAVSVPAGDAVELSNEPEASSPGWLNWKWLCGLGGVAAACTQVWFYRRITQPPLSLELACSQS
jgi:hypothetical protein